MPSIRESALLLVGIAGGSGVGLAIGSVKSDTTIVAAPVGAVEVPDAPELMQKIVDADTALPVTCEYGVISNHPRDIYCSDGARAGFLMGVDVESYKSEKFQLVDGKVYRLP